MRKHRYLDLLFSVVLIAVVLSCYTAGVLGATFTRPIKQINNTGVLIVKVSDFVTDFQGLTKTGETKFLNFPCDIYESESNGWTNIIAVERGMSIILRVENKQNGKRVQIMEATVFRPEKPAVALFEIPAGYKK